MHLHVALIIAIQIRVVCMGVFHLQHVVCHAISFFSHQSVNDLQSVGEIIQELFDCCKFTKNTSNDEITIEQF